MAGAAMLAAAPDPDGLGPLLHLARARQLEVPALIEAATGLAGRPEAAARLYETWIACNADHPGLAVLLFNYAVCLSDAGVLAGAANALREAVRLQPEFGPPSINLGGVLERLGQPGQAVETWLALVARHGAVTPDAVRYKLLALKQVGRVLEAGQQDAAAEAALVQCLALDPGQADAMQHLVALRQRQCKWPALEAGGGLCAGALRAGLSPLSAAYLVDDPLFQLATADRYARQAVGRPAVGQGAVGQGAARARRLEAVPAAPARLRVGYVSSDLRDHAVGFAMTEVLELHDRAVVEVFAYYCGVAADDGTQRRARAAVEHWRDLTGLDDAQADALIRRDGIDVLVDLNGYTKDARTAVFAMRPAPVAVNWFGFPGSMGTPYHHYLVADERVIPESHALFYSERVVRLPCYQPNDRRRVVGATPSRVDAGLPAAGFVFCCLNGLQKLTPEVFRCWMGILLRVPGSVLWLLSGTEETNGRLRAEAAGMGVDPARLVFAPKLANPEHLARLGLGGLFLDTFPYGAHTTASDALWMGVPVLTVQGRSFASRVCASLVAAAGLPELVCADLEEYAARAVALAGDAAGLAALRARLVAGRDGCVLFDTPLLVRSLERLFGAMHRARLAGDVPRPDLRNLPLYHEIGAAAGFEPAAEDAAYLAQYREGLAAVDACYPVERDGRVW